MLARVSRIISTTFSNLSQASFLNSKAVGVNYRSTIYKLGNEKIISRLNTNIPSTHLKLVILKCYFKIHDFQNAIVNKWNDTISQN